MATAEQGQEVRRRLLAAAAELIPERGWTAVSTRVLAQRAGVTPSVVHYHFPSVAALLNEAVIAVMQGTVAELDGLLGQVRTPADAVDALCASLDRYRGDDALSLLFFEGYLAGTRDPELRERIAGVLDGFGRTFGDWLGTHGVAAPQEVAAVLMAAIDGLVLRRGLGGDLDVTVTATVLRRLLSASRDEGDVR
ncbi:MAG TPA: TetR/AcrR family transcriptional regulator [Streptosporangiaceae bacterium]